VDKERMRDAARSTAGQAKSEALDMVVNGIVTDKFTTDADIDALRNAHLTPEAKEKAKAFMHSRETTEARQAEKKEIETNGVRNFVALQNEVEAYDPKTDKDHQKYAEFSRRIATTVPADLRDELRKPLTEKYGGEMPNAKLRPEIERNVSATLSRMFDETAGVMPWKTKVQVRDAKGRPETLSDGRPKMQEVENAEVHQRAIDTRTKLELSMQEWFRANPDKKNDPAAVQKALSERLPEASRAGPAQSLQNEQTNRTTEVRASGATV
jgi:hypothetical protein